MQNCSSVDINLKKKDGNFYDASTVYSEKNSIKSSVISNNENKDNSKKLADIEVGLSVGSPLSKEQSNIFGSRY